MAAKKLTVAEFQCAIIQATFAALRASAPLAPGVTPEFLAWHAQILDVAEASLTSHALQMALQEVEIVGDGERTS